MRNFVKVGSIGLVLVLGIAVVTPTIQAAKKASPEEQVAVLLKRYWNNFEEGKYKQAEQVAELAQELAPEDPQIAVALKLAQRQQAKTSSNTEVESQLEKVLQKLDRVERQLRAVESKSRRRTIVQIAKEPPGSPDGNY
jgi:hypothetical protein